MNADTPTPERVAELAAGLRQECDFAEAVAKKSCTRPYDVLMARAANRREIADALDALSRTSAPRMFPIQAERGAKPHPLRIPWDIAELAYSVYAARYGTDQSLEQLGQRGGFGPGEMDELLPDWRERCDALAALGRERDELRRDRDRLDWLQSVMTPGTGYVEVYLAGLRNGGGWSATAFQCELSSHYGISGETLRAAIDNCKADAEARLAAGQTGKGGGT